MQPVKETLWEEIDGRCKSGFERGYEVEKFKKNSINLFTVRGRNDWFICNKCFASESY